MQKDFQTDEQIVAIVRTVNHDMYSEIIKRYKDKLFHYLRKFIYDQDELEDVLQDVFIKAYRNLYNFNINKKFSPWIYRIAHNEALNHIKKYKKESFSLDEKEFDIIDESLDIKDKIDNKIVKNKIEQALLKMKDKYRESLVLYYFEQKTYEEISEIMLIPKSTVGTLIMRGKNILKKILVKEVYGK